MTRSTNSKNVIIVVGAVASGILILVGLSAFLRYRATAPLVHPPEHGISFVIETESPATNRSPNDLAALKDAVQQRSDRVGARIYWEPISETRIRVAVATGNPGDGRSLQSALFRRGMLEFRLVHEESDQLINSGDVPFGYEILKHDPSPRSGNKRVEKLVVKKEPEAGLSGNLIKRAMVMHGNLGEPEIGFTMQPAAAAAFAILTRDNLGRRLAIVIDGELYSAPTIQSPIENGSGMITGQFDAREAVELTGALDCPLPVSIKVVESQSF
jgi:SecD/SecF fusion protein